MARSGTSFLVLRDPAEGQILVSLNGLRHLTIGRRTDSDVAVHWDDRVSRLHAQLLRVGREWVVADDGLSVNGTWIGAVRVTSRHRLCDGDVIRVGDTYIAFCSPSISEIPTARAADIGATLRISPAQHRVLTALCKPLLFDSSVVPPSNRELCEELSLAPDSVKTHLRALYEIFGLAATETRQKRAALVERAVAIGVVRRVDIE